MSNKSGCPPAFLFYLSQKHIIMFNLHKIHQISLHSRKLVLLSLIAVALIMDLAILDSNKRFTHDTSFYAPISYVPAKPWIKKAHEMLKGTPMEAMLPYISGREKNTAAFLISVAKKESNWGKRSPMLAGNTCYNYWGYRGHTGMETPSGYTCFSSPEEAISTVGDRFSDLINNGNFNTPSKMIVWKCGFDCSWDDPTAMKDWIHDVNHYYQKFYE